MNSLTIWLYVSSVVVVGLLTAFAVHNQRVGWKKTRTTLAEALDDLYADLGLSVDPSPDLREAERSHTMIAKTVERRVDPSDFSDQLIHLSKALGESAGVKPNEIGTGESTARKRETVPVQAR